MVVSWRSRCASNTFAPQQRVHSHESLGMLKYLAFRQVVKSSQLAPASAVLGHFQTPLVQDRYETRPRQALDTTPREVKQD